MNVDARSKRAQSIVAVAVGLPVCVGVLVSVADGAIVGVEVIVPVGSSVNVGPGVSDDGGSGVFEGAGVLVGFGLGVNVSRPGSPSPGWTMERGVRKVSTIPWRYETRCIMGHTWLRNGVISG